MSFFARRAGRAHKGSFAVTRKFDGKTYSIYASRRYTSKADAESDAAGLRRQGYSARVVGRRGHWLIYQRRR